MFLTRVASCMLHRTKYFFLHVTAFVIHDRLSDMLTALVCIGISPSLESPTLTSSACFSV